MGCVPNTFPGGKPVGAEAARELGARWGFPVPDWTGRFMLESVDAAARGDLDVLYTVGSNLLGVLPDRRSVESALDRVPLRVHHDIVLNPSMLLEPRDTVSCSRHHPLRDGGRNTETSTERRVIFNPEIPGPVAEARTSGACSSRWCAGPGPSARTASVSTPRRRSGRRSPA